MKKIGLIGGMSWESTLPYYKIINEVVNEKLGGLYSADCILHSINFHKIESTISKGDWDMSNELLTQAATDLEIAGVDFVAICSNTMHKCIPAIRQKTNIDILHIVDATADEIKNKGMKSALLLGTRFTMEETFNVQRFEENGIKIKIPNLKERKIVHEIIFRELCKGIVTQESWKKYSDIIYKYCPDQADGVILGCTEIGLLIKQEAMEVPVFDTTLIHANRIALYSI